MLSDFTTWWVKWYQDALGLLYNIFIDVLQYLVDCVPVFVTAVLQLFTYACPPPPLPVGSSASNGSVFAALWSIFLQTINWLLPMQFLIYYIHFIICAMTAYFAVMIIGRWTKILT